jgi:hypothetical protein
MSKQLVYQALLALLFPVYSKTRRTRPVFNRGADSIETSLSDKTENSILSKKNAASEKIEAKISWRQATKTARCYSYFSGCQPASA